MKYTSQTRSLIAQTSRNPQQNQENRWTYSKKILKIKDRNMKRYLRNKNSKRCTLENVDLTNRKYRIMKKQERGKYSERIRAETKNKFKPKMIRKIIWETNFENTDKGLKTNGQEGSTKQKNKDVYSTKIWKEKTGRVKVGDAKISGIHMMYSAKKYSKCTEKCLIVFNI